MAEEKELELDKPKKSKKLIIIIAAVVIVALIGGGAAFFFLGGSDDGYDGEQTSSGSESSSDGSASVAKKGSALYVPLPRPFRFNVPGSVRDRFVEIKVQLLVRSTSDEETAQKHVPLIESSLLLVFSRTNADDLESSVGKDALKEQALAEVQKVMLDVEGSQVVEQVLFTGFVMQ